MSPVSTDPRGGAALSNKHRTFFNSKRLKARAHEARTHGVVSNWNSFLRSIFKIKWHVR